METTITFIIILAILVFVHELGHFLAAKAVGARVDKFAIGFPPRLVGKKVGDTDYAINLIPFGGYVSIHGEQYDEKDTGADSARSLAHKNRAAQALVFAAGIIMNVVFAWVLLSAGFVSGLPASVEGTKYGERVQDARVIVTSVRPDSPAVRAGLLPGDEILYVGSSDGQGVIPLMSRDVSDFIAPRANKQITFLMKRGAERVTVSAVAEEGSVLVSENVSGRAAPRAVVGISLDTVGILKLPVHLALVEGARATYVMTREIVIGMSQFLSQVIRGKADFSAVSGPVGIASVVGEVRELGWAYLVTFTAFISVNLAVLNVLPFPALDGGRLLFVFIESVTRRRIPVKIAQSFNVTGFLLLMVLMVVVTFRDVARLM